LRRVIEICATSIEYSALNSGYRLRNSGRRSSSTTNERSKILLILKGQAYAAVVMGNLVLAEEHEGSSRMRVMQKDCKDALTQLMLTPLTGLPVAAADKQLAQLQLSVAVAAAAALQNLTSCLSTYDRASSLEGDGRLLESTVALISGVRQMHDGYNSDPALLTAVEQVLSYLFGIVANLAACALYKFHLLQDRSLIR
jgi:hypothetical protein